MLWYKRGMGEGGRWWISGRGLESFNGVCVRAWTAIEASVLCVLCRACLVLLLPPSTQLFLSEPGLFQEPGMWLMRLILSEEQYSVRSGVYTSCVYVPRRVLKAATLAGRRCG
ncbi:hypothetical protein LZ31DRAFT_393536 [Colletotrichum somersetense]|nr:hypothetical protein LZ31DRAFT_393536 [Colletotrichum somersetense]